MNKILLANYWVYIYMSLNNDVILCMYHQRQNKSCIVFVYRAI
jgi:hypothetical protein